MTPFATQAPTPAVVRATASVCRDVLEPFADADWDGPAGELEWSCRTTLAHVLAALLYYAINLATRSTEPRFSGTDPSLAVVELLDALEGRVAVLAEVCAAAPPGARAREAHDWGTPDATGFAAFGCNEISCTRTTSPMGSKPPSNHRATSAAAYSLACSLGAGRRRPLAGAVVGERPLGA